MEKNRNVNRLRLKKRLIRQRSFRIYRMVTVVFLVFILVVGIVNFVKKDKTYSETENRMLAQKATMTLANLASGEYMTDVENYVTDQFFLRDKWIDLKVMADMALGKRESNGVYIGKDGALLEISDSPDFEALDRNVAAINDFAERYSEMNTVMTLVPNAGYICDQLRPSNAPVRDQSEDIFYVSDKLDESVNFVNLTETMSAHKNESIYYKTDHHWTSLGASYAFETLCPALGIEEPVENYTVYPVANDFQGTLASKSGYHKSYDTVEIYVPESENMEYIVDYVDEQKKTSSVYVSEALDQKDKYEVFFGGNYARVDVMMPSEENKNLLIFKDSYANCFVQFLIPYYRTIVMVDPRYYYDNIETVIRDNNITDVLFLYNVNTFMTDNSLADVLAEDTEADSGVDAGSDNGADIGSDSGMDAGGSEEIETVETLEMESV